MRILVTGGAGFIGSHLVRRLLADGHERVVNLDALRYSGNLENLSDVAHDARYRFVHADICDQAAVENALAEHAIEAVINCAAETHVDRSILDPNSFAKTDVVGTASLLEASRKAKIARFLQVSTDEVYGSVETGSSTEDDRLEPRSPYSASKAGADLLVRSYWTTYGFPVLITRGSNTYGPNQYPEKFIPLFTTNLLDGRPIVLDSSKNVKISYRRPYLLREMGYELRFLHLVRDPRAVMYSVAKGLESGLAKGEVAHLPGGKYRSLYGWTSANLSAEILRRSFPSGSFLRVRYEDLMTDLSGQLDRIGEFLGIDMRPLAQQVAGTGTLDPGHGVSGNRMRRQGPIQVKYDQAWTKLVRPTDQLVWLPAWPLAARYGYRWGRSGIST